ILYWPTFALTQSPHNLWLLQLNQLSGPMTTTAVIVAVNGLIAEAWVVYRRSQTRASMTLFSHGLGLMTGSITGRYLVGAFGITAIAHLLGLWLYSYSPYNYSPLDAENVITTASVPLNVGLIQANIPTRIKLTGQGIRQAFDRYTIGYQSLVEEGADIVLMPEGALPMIWPLDRSPRHSIATAIGESKVPAILGTFVPTPPSDTDTDTHEAIKGRDSGPLTITQSLLLVMPVHDGDDSSGQLDNIQRDDGYTVVATSRYNKIKLVPLGEYIPAEGVLGAIINRLSPIQSTMVPGRTDQTFQTPWGRVTLGICYESAFSELFRRQTLAGGEWIITASNNDPYNGAMMAQHHAQDVMRAIESDRWTVRVTNTGYSGLVNPRGETIWRSQRNSLETYLAVIQRRQSRTLYVRWGNWMTPSLLGASVVTILWASWRRHRF
ncbi:MAG: apolipoprotein N-acyltransferase, partial [Merismopedia sp. SIO2A8]|nr:apolipoprotein N-acyltransferase [Merismopedia sp. SIO2A8]